MLVDVGTDAAAFLGAAVLLIYTLIVTPSEDGITRLLNGVLALLMLIVVRLALARRSLDRWAEHAKRASRGSGFTSESMRQLIDEGKLTESNCIWLAGVTLSNLVAALPLAEAVRNGATIRILVVDAKHDYVRDEYERRFPSQAADLSELQSGDQAPSRALELKSESVSQRLREIAAKASHTRDPGSITVGYMSEYPTCGMALYGHNHDKLKGPFEIYNFKVRREWQLRHFVGNSEPAVYNAMCEEFRNQWNASRRLCFYAPSPKRKAQLERDIP